MIQDLTQLGSKTPLPNSPEEAHLEMIPIDSENAAINKCIVRLTCPEFTSLCPVTGQPDFANIYVDYAPNTYLIESKSFKLFMGSFRNHGAFHESVTSYIGDRLYKEMFPKWIRVIGIWYPRGGIPIDVFFEAGSRQDLQIPELRLNPYRGR